MFVFAIPSVLTSPLTNSVTSSANSASKLSSSSLTSTNSVSLVSSVSTSIDETTGGGESSRTSSESFCASSRLCSGDVPGTGDAGRDTPHASSSCSRGDFFFGMISGRGAFVVGSCRATGTNLFRSATAGFRGDNFSLFPSLRGGGGIAFASLDTGRGSGPWEKVAIFNRGAGRIFDWDIDSLSFLTDPGLRLCSGSVSGSVSLVVSVFSSVTGVTVFTLLSISISCSSTFARSRAIANVSSGSSSDELPA